MIVLEVESRKTLDYDFVIVLAQQVAEGLYQLLFVGIVLSEIDG